MKPPGFLVTIALFLYVNITDDVFLYFYSGIKPYEGVRPESRGGCHGETNWGRPPRPPFLTRRFIDCSVKRPSRRKDLYSPVHECWSTCLSNLWLAHAPTLRHGPAPTHKHYKYSSPRGSGIEIGSHWVQFDWDSSEPLWWSLDRCSPNEI